MSFVSGGEMMMMMIDGVQISGTFSLTECKKPGRA